MKTFHIHIKGIVQGVGFRPFIYRLANEKNLNGTVSNTTDGVHILISSTEDIAQKFIEIVELQAPARAIISEIEISEVKDIEFKGFKIVESKATQSNSIMLTPDFAICEDCRKDIETNSNKRHAYAFTTCTLCGPRYSIVNRIPYDRINTTMHKFTTCNNCAEEYHNVSDRRYYSQTNSCPDCLVKMSMETNEGFKCKGLSEHDILEKIVNYWEEGKIVAIKGVGGYIITCDATNKESIIRLRKLKNRPSKPFATMYSNLLEMAEDVDIDAKAMISLQGVEAPIVLANKKEEPWSGAAFEAIAPNLGKVGVMLANTPQMVLLLDKLKKPIIATSGNLSGDPIEYLNRESGQRLLSLSDAVLHNNRDIVVPQDDSVWNITPVNRHRIILRRSKGMAPSILLSHLPKTTECILSMGGILKSTFGLTAHQSTYVSQYLGDTDNYRAQSNYKSVLNHLLDTFQVKPDVIICDKHPGYFSSVEGERMAKEMSIPVIKVQHHKAHMFAILTEHNLMQCKESIMGVIWDGTGLGDDGNIWGGEIFIYNGQKISRATHIPYFDHRLGDKMAKEPRISALSLLGSYDVPHVGMDQKFSTREWEIYPQMFKTSSSLKCSSMGRVFDALTSIVLGVDRQSYEGEAAMMLENEAHKFLSKNFYVEKLSYLSRSANSEMAFKTLVSSCIDDSVKGIPSPLIAARIHVSLIDYIGKVAKDIGVQHIAFSGGTFQNAWLVDLAWNILGKKHKLYFHNMLSPNDENIAFGQLAYHIYNHHQ